MKRSLALVLLILLLLCGAANAVMFESAHVLAVADPTWVRSAPEIAENIVDKLASGNTYEWGNHVFFDERDIAWYDVYYSGKYGWVSSLHANLIDDESGVSFNATDVVLGNMTAIVATDVTGVLDEPESGNLIGILFEGEGADYTGMKKEVNGKIWYQVNYYNNSGWVSSDYAEIR